MENAYFIVLPNGALAAVRPDVPKVALVVDYQKSNREKGIFYITETVSPNQTPRLYTVGVPRKLKDAVNIYFDILLEGGILYTTDQYSNHWPKGTRTKDRYHILELAFGVERTWNLSDVNLLLTHDIQLILSQPPE